MPADEDEICRAERQLRALEARSLLHGSNNDLENEIKAILDELDDIECSVNENWLMQRDHELGRAFQ